MRTIVEKSYTSTSSIFRAKLSDYAAFVKLRLASLVVFSAVFGYLIAADAVIWFDLFVLIIGGFLLTASSNGLNEIMERDLDKLMERTKERPLATNRMSLSEAYIIAILSGNNRYFITVDFSKPIEWSVGAIGLI